MIFKRSGRKTSPILLGIFFGISFFLAYRTSVNMIRPGVYQVDGNSEANPGNNRNSEDSSADPDRIMIAVLVRNKAHVLPWFFGHLENLNYPKTKLIIWLRSDHNEDNSSAIIREWREGVKGQYWQTDVHVDDSKRDYDDKEGPLHWSKERFDTVMYLRDQAFIDARKKRARYLFMLDADVIFENPETLNTLKAANRTIVAPLLRSGLTSSYSNFWAGMTRSGYYRRHPIYLDILERRKQSIFPVPMVHHALLIDLSDGTTQRISYSRKPMGYSGPHDDIIVFAHSVREQGLPMHVVNTEEFGFLTNPMGQGNTLQDDEALMAYIKIRALDHYRPGLRLSPYVHPPGKKLDKIGFDEIFVINLKRRHKRRERMQRAFVELGLNVTFVDGIDGKDLNKTYLDSLGVKMLPGYLDPYHKRPLTVGEIGCFLSHYNIWKKVKDNNLKQVLIFEDDVQFEPYFRKKFTSALSDLSDYFQSTSWDFLYLGRKVLQADDEYTLGGLQGIMEPSYSYWTVGYAITNEGADKLLAPKPLNKMVAVDEYIPIVCNTHPRDDWTNQFSPRRLHCLSVRPLLVYPTFFAEDILSDTENSAVIRRR